MTSDKAEIRRRYSRDFKAQVMAECDVPGASVAKCVFRKSVTGHFGIVTDDFGNVTGDFGAVTDGRSGVS